MRNRVEDSAAGEVAGAASESSSDAPDAPEAAPAVAAAAAPAAAPTAASPSASAVASAVASAQSTGGAGPDSGVNAAPPPLRAGLQLQEANITTAAEAVAVAAESVAQTNNAQQPASAGRPGNLAMAAIIADAGAGHNQGRRSPGHALEDLDVQNRNAAAAAAAAAAASPPAPYSALGRVGSGGSLSLDPSDPRERRFAWKRRSQQEADEDEDAGGEAVRLISWGQNAYGELGHGDTETRRQGPSVVDFVAANDLVLQDVVAGNEHTAILTRCGQVFCVGYNDSGQCGVGTANRVFAFQRVEALRDKKVVKLASANGCEHVLAITADGELLSWGYNSRGQLGHNVTTHMAVPRVVQGLAGKRVLRVACSYYHTVASTAEDEVYAFGRNDFGQLGLGDTVDKYRPERVTALPRGMVTSLAVGQYHTVFSLQGEGLFSCGKNDYGQLGVSAQSSEPRLVPVQVLPPFNASVVGAAAVAASASASASASAGADVGGIGGSGEAAAGGVVLVAAGYYHTVALTAAGVAYAWGRGDHGQLGLGSRENKGRPQRVEGVAARITQVTAGCYHTMFLTSDGKVFACGRNNHHQLGIAAEPDCALPLCVEGLAEHHVSKVAAGFYHSACLTGPRAAAAAAPPPPTLSADLGSLVNNPVRADVTFIVQGRPLYAHRCVLMARCEPFEAMLHGSMLEATQQEVELKDLEYPVMLALLEFLYTDEVQALDAALGEKLDIDFALDLLAVADQFLVHRLKRLCEMAIQKSISVDNVAVMLRTADLRQARALRKRCFEFLLNNFGKVIGTEGLVALPPDLMREVLKAAYDRGVSIRPTT